MPTLIFLMYLPKCKFIVLWMIKLLLCMTNFKVILSEITSTYPRGQWVNCCHFVFSQMTSSWFWVPSPIIWLGGHCSSRAVCSFCVGWYWWWYQNNPICNDLPGTGKLFERNIDWLLSLWIVIYKNINSDITSMGKCKKDITPLLVHWSHVFLALTHRHDISFCYGGDAKRSVTGARWIILKYWA